MIPSFFFVSIERIKEQSRLLNNKYTLKKKFLFLCEEMELINGMSSRFNEEN